MCNRPTKDVQFLAIPYVVCFFNPLYSPTLVLPTTAQLWSNAVFFLSYINFTSFHRQHYYVARQPQAKLASGRGERECVCENTRERKGEEEDKEGKSMTELNSTTNYMTQFCASCVNRRAYQRLLHYQQLIYRKNRGIQGYPCQNSQGETRQMRVPATFTSSPPITFQWGGNLSKCILSIAILLMLSCKMRKTAGPPSTLFSQPLSSHSSPAVQLLSHPRHILATLASPGNCSCNINETSCDIKFE